MGRNRPSADHFEAEDRAIDKLEGLGEATEADDRDGGRAIALGVLSEWTARLPNPVDRDVLALRFREVAEHGVGRVFNISQPSVVYRIKAIKARLKLIKDTPDLQMKEAEREPTVAALVRSGTRREQAECLWEIAWTTSPTEAARRTKMASAAEAKRVCAVFLSRSENQRSPRVARLASTLRYVVKKAGCLWGRSGGAEKPGTKGHRVVAGVLDVRGTNGQRRPPTSSELRHARR